MASVLATAIAAPVAYASFPQSINQTVPAGGSATVGSSAIPATAKSATITAKPVDAAGDKTFDKLTKVLSSGTKGRGVVFCAITFALLFGDANWDANSEKGSNPSLAYLLLKACIQMALQLGRPVTARASAASCPRSDRALPVKITRSGGRYRLQATGKPKQARRAPLVVSCRRLRHGIRLRLRPRSAKRTLRQVVGNKLTLGYLNPATGTSVNVRTTFDVK